MADNLRAEDFAPLLGKDFQPAGHPQRLTLVHVDTHAGASWNASPRKPFVLILRGPYGDVVPEGFHRLAADGQRDFDLYLAPIQTASREYQDYQVVFN